MGIVVVPVAASGLIAASVLANAPWLAPDAVSRHRLAGILTAGVLVVLGGFSGAALSRLRTTATISRSARAIVLLLAAAGFGVSAWTAYLGAALRHSELGR